VETTRRRGEALTATILEAAWAEVREVGYPKLTMEGVAARAHTGKQVIYRRWPNRSQLIVAAIRHVLGPLAPDAIDTGSLRGDVLTLLRRMAGRAKHYGPDLLYGLLSEQAQIGGEMFGGLPRVMMTIIDQAVRRGELAHGDLPERVVSLPIDLARYEGLRNIELVAAMTDDDIEGAMAEIVDTVFLPLVMAIAGKKDEITSAASPEDR
jgi:AcrR family transcriptional regulator